MRGSLAIAAIIGFILVTEADRLRWNAKQGAFGPAEGANEL
jgi:hypothetical protein